MNKIDQYKRCPVVNYMLKELNHTPEFWDKMNDEITLKDVIDMGLIEDNETTFEDYDFGFTPEDKDKPIIHLFECMVYQEYGGTNPRDKEFFERMIKMKDDQLKFLIFMDIIQGKVLVDSTLLELAYQEITKELEDDND